MKLSSIRDLLTNQESIENFLRFHSNEIHDYRSGLTKTGGTAPVVLIEDCTIFLDKEALLFLLRLFMSHTNFDKVSLFYILDALTLSSSVDFNSEPIRDHFESIVDADQERGFGFEDALELIDHLDENDF